MAIAPTIAIPAPLSPLSSGLMPLVGANAPPAMDGFDAVFSAILSQIVDGAVGNNQPGAAIPAVANDAGVPQISPLAASADANVAASGTDPLQVAPPVTAAEASAPVQPNVLPQDAPMANATKPHPAPATINAAAVSLLEAQNVAVPTPKTTNSAPSSDSARPAPKQNAKQAAPAASLLATIAPVAPVPPVAPVAPVAPADASALPAAAAASSATPLAVPPIGDAGDDEPDAPSASSAPVTGAATSTAADQSIAASTGGDFLADLKSGLSQAQSQTPASATPTANGAQFTASAQPSPGARKAAPPQTADNKAAAAQTSAASQKSDANSTTPLTQLAAKDQDNSSSDRNTATADTSQQAAQTATPAPSTATLSSTADNTAASSALGSQQPLQAQAAMPAATLHVGPQTSASHAPATSDLDSLGVAIAAKSLDGIKHFDIRLDPPELGRVEVRLSVGDDGKAQASLSVERPQTLQLLQNDASSLNRALKDAGLNLSDSGLSFSLRGQDRQASDGGASQQKGRSLSVRALASIDAASQVSSNAYTTLSPDTAGVDIRV